MKDTLQDLRHHVCDTPKIGDVCPSCGKGTVYKMNWAALNCDYCHTEWSRVGAA